MVHHDPTSFTITPQSYTTLLLLLLRNLRSIRSSGIPLQLFHRTRAMSMPKSTLSLHNQIHLSCRPIWTTFPLYGIRIFIHCGFPVSRDQLRRPLQSYRIITQFAELIIRNRNSPLDSRELFKNSFINHISNSRMNIWKIHLHFNTAQFKSTNSPRFISC